MSADTPAPDPGGLEILAVDEDNRPVPGTCFAVAVGLRGAELLPGLAEVDLGALRAGIVVGEVCDDADGRADGVLTVAGAVADVEQDIAAVLADPDADPDLMPILERVTVTIDLVQTRAPAANGGLPSVERLPQLAISLADLGDGGSVQVVYRAGGSLATPSPDETPATSDGTGIIDEPSP